MSVRFRVVEPFPYTNAKGRRVDATPGELIDIMQRVVADELLRDGKIVPRVLSAIAKKGTVASSGEWSHAMRIGIWLRTSAHYSGGRIHMFQYAWCLANAGADVYLVTNAVPKWLYDYPPLTNIHIVMNDDKPPEDLDIIITDSKDSLGKQALDWKKRHPWVPLVCMNFETPNWIAKFAKDKAITLQQNPTVFAHADLLLANSDESMKYLGEWMDTTGKLQHVIRPAINTHAIDAAKESRPKEFRKPDQRPYAVWCARGQKYKGVDVAFDAVFKTTVPLDLVLFGSYNQSLPQSTDLHRVFKFNGLPDKVKFYAMAHAQMVLAPSLFEGFGMIPGEATACGTPVVAFNLPVIKKEYKGLKGIYYVKHGDKDAYAKKVQALASKPKVTVDPKPVVERLGMGAMAKTIESIPYHSIKRQRITVQLITYWGFVSEALEAVYEYADEIVIAHGRVKHAQEIDDGTLDKVRAFPDPDNKIKLEVRDEWDNKREMRAWCSDYATGNRMLLLDGDEIWTGLDEWIKANIFFGTPRWVNLWHGPDNWIHDHKLGMSPRWGGKLEPFGSPCHHYRWSFWRRSYNWKQHHTPADHNGRPLTCRDTEIPRKVPGCVIYHLGHALHPDVMKAKHEFYLTRDGNDAGRQKRMAAWHDWDGKTGNCGDGMVEKVSWKLPEIVTRACKSAKEVLA